MYSLNAYCLKSILKRMFLSNKTISKYIYEGKIIVNGKLNIETKGISINLGSELLIPKPKQIFDTKKPKELKYDKYDLFKKPYILKPNGFVLGSTQQSIRTDRDIITMLDGRSTYARAGLMIHLTALVLDGVPFNHENSVLEIKNLGNFDIVLHEGERIGTYLFAKLTEPIVGEKKGRYTDQDGVVPPRI
jgi:deoxycytidine triphosphate deaminase